jgi:hypothetical protein
MGWFRRIASSTSKPAKGPPPTIFSSRVVLKVHGLFHAVKTKDRHGSRLPTIRPCFSDTATFQRTEMAITGIGAFVIDKIPQAPRIAEFEPKGSFSWDSPEPKASSAVEQQTAVDTSTPDIPWLHLQRRLRGPSGRISLGPKSGHNGSRQVPH